MEIWRRSHVLVFAENKVEAIKKVKDGWEYKWDYTDEGVILTYGKNFKKEYSYVNDKITTISKRNKIQWIRYSYQTN